MENNIALLKDAFDIYYEKGMDALKNKQYSISNRNILAASETLLKMAKSSKGVVKAQRIKRAEELCSLANQIERKVNEEYSTKNNANSDIQMINKGQSSSRTENQNSESVKKDEELTNFIPVDGTGVMLSDVAGLEQAKDEISRLIIEPMKHPEIYSKFKKNKGGGILLYGVPGTGKTMIAQAIANEIDAKFYSIKCSDIASKWFGDSEQNVKNLFVEARKHPCSIIFFDEFEALGTKRDSYSTVMKRLVPELLSQMQGFTRSNGILLLIAATNRPWDIDSAFLRPGRFNTQIYVPLPNSNARRTIIEKQLEGLPIESGFDKGKIIEHTEGFNGSDVVEFCDKMKDYAIKRSIDKGYVSEMTNDDILRTLDRVKSSVRMDDLRKMAKYEEISKNQ
jgi:SpoVK/Ycf46/Vps4 family AAA+-type ATPase